MTHRPTHRPDAPTEEIHALASTRTPSGRELTASYSRNHGARALVLTSRDPRGAPQRLTLPARSLGWLREALARIDGAGMLTGEAPEAVCTPPARAETILPDPALADAYAERMARYRDLYARGGL